MKNKFRQNIVIGVIAIVGTMGYNLNITCYKSNIFIFLINIISVLIKKMKMFDL